MFEAYVQKRRESNGKCGGYGVVFPCNVSKFVYLSPRLKEEHSDLVIGVVVHELAHVVLHHPAGQKSDDETVTAEKDAADSACSWGFARPRLT